MMGECDEPPQAGMGDGIALYSWVGTWSSSGFSCRTGISSKCTGGGKFHRRIELKQCWGTMRCWNQFYCLSGVAAGLCVWNLSWLMALFVCTCSSKTANVTQKVSEVFFLNKPMTRQILHSFALAHL